MYQIEIDATQIMDKTTFDLLVTSNNLSKPVARWKFAIYEIWKLITTHL